MDLHVVCELRENGMYYCIPKYSRGNGTEMTFASLPENQQRFRTRFFDSLDEALGNKNRHNMIEAAKEEDRRLTGYYNREY